MKISGRRRQRSVRSARLCRVGRQV